MDLELSTYRKFIYKDDALEVIQLLEQNQIDYELKDNSSRLDASFGADDNTAEFELKIHKDDFQKVEKLEEDLVKSTLDSVQEDYFLFEYSDEELIEIVIKKDEWNKFDYLLAQKILKERGKEINPELLKVINKQRVKDLAIEEPNPKWLIFAGYFFALLGGYIGVFIGLYIMKYKKALPNGDKMYAYNKEVRKQGQNVLICSVIGAVFWLIVKFLYD